MKDLKNSKTICTKEYAKRFNVSIRTIQRYLEDISQFLQEEPIEVKRGCYKFLNFSKIKEHLLEPADREDFEKIAFFLNATDQKLLKYLGIDEKIIDRIFEPYFTTKFQSQGTGIGLYMSRVIITQHFNGELYAYNSKSGAVFVIKFK